MPKSEPVDVNFFKPRGGSMKREIRLIVLVLAGWLLAVAGSQGFVYLLASTRLGAFLSAYTFFNLPMPFWLTGHFLPFWFIILCVLFNVWMDRHARQNLDGSLRFRARNDPGRET